MAKKNKSQPANAPELQQILLDSPTSQQPPHNPYYPDLRSVHQVPPPPYSDLSTSAPGHSVPMSRIDNTSANYTRFSSNLPRQAPTVIVQQAPLRYDRRAEKFHQKIRRYNGELFIACIVMLVLSIYAYGLYERRPCVNYLVHQVSQDVSVNVKDVRDMHWFVAYGCIFMLLVSLARCGSGQSKDYSCYLFLVRVGTFVATIYTGYLAYLAFYSPCTLRLSDLASNAIKTALGSFANNIPSPDKGYFGESNVLELAKEDKQGVAIFFIDVFNFVLSLSAFFGAIC